MSDIFFSWDRSLFVRRGTGNVGISPKNSSLFQQLCSRGHRGAGSGCAVHTSTGRTQRCLWIICFLWQPANRWTAGILCECGHTGIHPPKEVGPVNRWLHIKEWEEFSSVSIFLLKKYSSIKRQATVIVRNYASFFWRAHTVFSSKLSREKEK